MTVAIDIDVDWNTQDDTGMSWTFRDEAIDPSRIVVDTNVILATADDADPDHEPARAARASNRTPPHDGRGGC